MYHFHAKSYSDIKIYRQVGHHAPIFGLKSCLRLKLHQHMYHFHAKEIINIYKHIYGEESHIYLQKTFIVSTMASKPHILIFPFMAQGHTIPLLDLSKALSSRGLKVTILTTPSNSSSIKSYISEYSNTVIIIKEIPFPKVEGLPKGCENMSHIFVVVL